MGGTVDDPRYEAWVAWAALLEEEKPSLALVFKHLMGGEASAAESEVDIFRALFKVLSPGRMPVISEGIAYGELCDAWNRKNDGSVLESAEGVHHRYQGADSMLMASPLAIWPPPIELVAAGCEAAEGASCCWDVRFDRPPPREALMEALRDWTNKGWKGATWFRKGESFSLHSSG